MQTRTLEPGQMIGRFELVQLLGRGGMGEVWEAIEPDEGRRVALKLIKDAEASPQLIKRFAREVKAASAVDHPGVVKVYEVIEADDGLPVMVMELLEGESLADRLGREEEMPVETVASIMLSVVSAVGSAHGHGIVHRDLKPENIFLVEGADGELDVRVLDFGIAKLVAEGAQTETTAGLTTTGSILGTPCYMAPEQVFGEKDVDHRVDIWALGILLYEMLTGILPTAADNVGQVLKIIVTRGIFPLADAAPDLPPELLAMVDRMLEREKKDRPADLREVQEVLERFAGKEAPRFGPPVSTRPEQISTSRLTRSKAATTTTPRPGSGPRTPRGTVKMQSGEHPVDETAETIEAKFELLGEAAVAESAPEPAAGRSWGRYAAVAAVLVGAGAFAGSRDATPPAGAAREVPTQAEPPVSSPPAKEASPVGSPRAAALSTAESAPREGTPASTSDPTPTRAHAPLPERPSPKVPASKPAAPEPPAPVPEATAPPSAPEPPGAVETELPPELGD